MEELKENGKKLGTKALAAIIIGAVAVVAIVTIVLVCTLGKKEESYRNIRVSEVTGTVVVNREGMEGLTAYANMNLLSGDEIVTEAGAQVSLRLDDDKYVILDEQSKLTLHATGTEEDSKTTLQLEYGAVFSDIKNKLSESSGYEVVTPASTMSVRGTQFEVVCRDKQVKILTYEGAVYVVPEGSAEGKMVSAGEWNTVIESADGTYEFDGETKKITAEDVGAFVASYLEEAGIEFEAEGVQTVTPGPKVTTVPVATTEPTKEPVAEPTQEPVATEAPAPTEVPVATPEATPSPALTAEPEATATPAPTKAPVATPEPAPTKAPVEALKPGEYAIYYYIPIPPKTILPSDKSYTVNYSAGVLTLATADSTDSYKANTAPAVTDAATLETDASPLISAVTENQLPEILDGRLAEYGEGTTAKCFGWYDTTKKMWFNWTQFLRDAALEGGVLSLYPAYTVQGPAYSVSCVPVVITVEETGEVFRLSVPEGSALKLGAGLKWKESGTAADTVTVQYSSISQFILSVGN